MASVESIQEAIDRLPRVWLGEWPTPLYFCKRLTEELGGPRIFMKRDDLTGLAFGGNKTRYLEFTLAEALDQGADAVVLSAVVHSNHCRQFAAAAAKLGLKAVVVLRESETQMGYREQPTGNYLLDQMFGAEIRFAASEAVRDTVATEMDRLREAGYQPFTGLSAVLSRVAYIQCALELIRQGTELGVGLRNIFIGSGHNSLAGLVAGFNLMDHQARFVGVPQGKLSAPQDAPGQVVGQAREAAACIGLDCMPDAGSIEVADQYAGPGFGLLDGPTKEAVQRVARTEGIVLDPTYSGKGFAGLLDHIRQGRLIKGEDVVFVHTGGTPLVFVYGGMLL